MKRLRITLFLIMPFLCLVFSCRKIDSRAQGYPGYYGIMANDPAQITGPFFYDISVPRFVIINNTTYSSFNHGNYHCGNYYTVEEYPKTNSATTMTYTIASAYVTTGIAASGVYVDTAHMSVIGCGNDNSSFELQPSKTLSIDSPVRWSVVINDTIRVFYIDSSSPPVVPNITSDSNISIHSGFTLAGTGPVSGDSIVFIITGIHHKGIMKVLGPGSTACTFTAAEMTSLGITDNSHPALAQIVSYRVNTPVINGKQCTFMKEACFSQYVYLH